MIRFETKWEHLDEGLPEEKAAFGAVGLLVNGECLTKWKGELTGRNPGTTLDAPFVSGFHLAEWIAWNWWRLRWEAEPEKKYVDWLLAHNLNAVDNGYVWPNVTIWSDGKRVQFETEPDKPDTACQYVARYEGSVPSREFEKAVDSFIGSVCERLDKQKIGDTNLHAIWQQLQSDRRDPGVSRRRRLEAAAGYGPQEESPGIVSKLLEEQDSLGEEAIDDLVAVKNTKLVRGGGVSEKLDAISNTIGFETAPHDRVQLHGNHAITVISGAKEAWEVGEEVAKSLRRQENLGEDPVDNKRLAEIVAVAVDILESSPFSNKNLDGNTSFALEKNARQRIALGAKSPVNRRFHLARLIGDQLVPEYEGPLHLSTWARTYRQKFQWAFAAEFLSPFEVVKHELTNNLLDKEERKKALARHFKVDPMVIKTQLINKDLGGRKELEGKRYRLK